MTKNGEKLMILLESSEELREEFLKCENVEEVKKFALEHDFELTDEDLDFGIEKQEIDANELEAVSGGDACGCFAGGYGGADSNFKGEHKCVCVVAGCGTTEASCNAPAVEKPRDANWDRCCCVAAGGGKDMNYDEATQKWNEEYWKRHRK